MTLSVTEVLDGLLGKFLRPFRTWIEREWVAPLRAAYDAAMQTKEQYRDGVYLHLRERLEGTDEHPLAEGVPVRPLPATQDLEHLQEAVELLGERKIEDASPDIPDGTSLLRICGSVDLASAITVLIDTNKGYIWNRERFNTNSLLLNMMFPNLEEVHIGCIKNTAAIFGQNDTIRKIVFDNMEENDYSPFWITSYAGGFSNLQEIEFPKLKVGGSLIYWHLSGWWNIGLLGLRSISLPELETIKAGVAIGSAFVSGTMPLVEELYMPKLKNLNSYLWGGGTISGLRRLIMPSLTNCNSAFCNTNYPQSPSKLIHLEVGAVNTNMDLRYWSPTNALRTDTTASDYIDLREDKDDSGEFIYQNNLQQFLSNFKNYIADRLADRSKTSALTLTLSQAVYNAIQADTEFAIVATITAKNWNITH